MPAEPVFRSQSSRRVQALAILAAAILQIAFARLTDFLNIGQTVEVRSDAAAHPLVPLGAAFAIWGIIYLYGLVFAIWQMGARQRNNQALRQVGWHYAVIGLMNALWQIWVPLRGFDIVSILMTGTSLTLGIWGLLKLRRMTLSRRDEILIAGPLALVTGWLTAAFCLNMTSSLVVNGAAVNPVDVNISLAFLIGLIAFAATVIAATHSLLYSAGITWALAFIMLANIYRDSSLAMASVALGGILLVAAIVGWQLYQSGHRGQPIHA